jgi:hypothetical protein
MEISLASLISDVFEGTFSLPVEEDVGYLERFLTPAPVRARVIEKVFSAADGVDYSKIWRNLRLISCWMDGPSRCYAQKLAKMFPRVVMQGKGLIATEGIVSIPLTLSTGHVPAYCSHFLEFQQEKGGETKFIDELDEGGSYSVILTTGGGLYRYHLGDQVLVVGRFEGLPVLEFIQRDKVVDFFGEKLDERHVSGVVRAALRDCQVDYEFALLAPHQEESVVRYVLFVQPQKDLAADVLSKVRERVDRGLKNNFHYQYACDLKQLSPLDIFIIRKDAHKAYLGRCLAEGQRLGDVKQVFLDRRHDWSQHFDGVWFKRIPSVEAVSLRKMSF